MPRKTGLFIASFLFLVTAACQTSPDAQVPSSEPPGEFLTLINAEGEEVQVAVPEPVFNDLMLSQVEGGEISLEDGIISALRIMAGETSMEESFASETVEFESAYILTAMAAELYQTSTNEAAKAEIARLMNIIAPPQERMDRYAAPEGSAANSGHSMLRPPARDEILCTSIWAEGFPEDVEDPPVCLLYRSFEAGGYEYRVYYPEERRGDATFLRYVEAAVEALRDSRDAYNPLSEIRSINVIFTLLESEWNFAASVPSIDLSTHGAAPCPISVFPRAVNGRLDVDKFKQAIAHEIFHCLEIFRIGSLGTDAQVWYQEGMAEYFSNVVYPSSNLEHRAARRFDINSVHMWLMDMSYENGIFFQYLGGRFGNGYLMNLLDTLAANGDSKSSQAAALASYGDMQTIFHEFGQAYLKREIMDTHRESGNWPSNPYFLPENFFTMGSGRDLSLSTDAFIVQRYLLTFETGREYQITRTPGGDPSRDTWRPPLPGAYTEIPLTYLSGCDEDPRRVLLFTAAPPSASISARSELELGFTSSESASMDCCLVGTWEQGTDEIRRNLEIILSPMELVDATGRFVLVVTADGNTTFTPVDYSGTVIVADEPATVSLTGVSTGTIRTPVEGIISSASTSESFVETLTTSETSMSFPIEGLGLSTGEFPYTCTETTLVINTAGLAPFESSTYQRISTIPATPESAEEFLEAPPEVPSEPSDIGGGEGMCIQVAAAGFSTSGSTARWDLSNSGSSLQLSALSVTWPGGNGNLESISVNGTAIWSGYEVSPAIITSGWLGDPTANSFGAGTTELTLTFSGPSIGSTGYGLILQFTSGCTFLDIR